MATRVSQGVGTSAFRLNDWSGGINMRDAAEQVAPNEAVDCMNVTLDEHGGVGPRLGLQRLNLTDLPGEVINIFYWQTPELIVFQVGNKLYKTVDFGTVTPFATLGSVDRCAFGDFLKQLVVVHPIDGFFAYDNISAWPTSADPSIKGTTLAVWQNKIWVSGDKAAPTRVKWSNIGATTFDANSYIDLREKDDAIVTAIGIGQGQDVSGRPGLLVFKEQSSYRINDSTTGSYTTIHPSAGAVSSLAVATLDEGAVGVIGADGIYVTDGVSALENVSGKLDPLFTPDGLNYATVNNWNAGVHQDRLMFSVARQGSGVNDLVLEFDPRVGWFMPHEFGVTAWTNYLKNTSKTYIGCPGMLGVCHAFVGGVDDGVPITSHWQSAWYELNGGAEARARRMRLWGRGAFTLQVTLDFDDRPGDEYDFDVGTAGIGKWGDGKWDTFAWGPGVAVEDRQDFYSLGHCTHLGFRFNAVTDTSVFGRNLLRDGNAIEMGEFALYGLRLDLVPLGAA